MKKLALFAVAAVAISLASCAGKGTTEAAPAADSTTVVEETVEAVVPDSASVDTVAVEEVATEAVK
jgi:predicted small lipoprotein YifL